MAFADQRLPSFSIETTQTSVSGLSSGAFMAVQFHTAFSARIMGVGVVAGGPFDCAFAGYPGPIDPVSEVSTTEAGIKRCTGAMPVPPDGLHSLRKAQQFAALGRIDSVDHVARSRVYIFSGTDDRTVVSSVAATNARIIGLREFPRATSSMCMTSLRDMGSLAGCKRGLRPNGESIHYSLRRRRQGL
jgi:hypothetical protein